jgi:four helix bundle protein
VEKAHKKLRVWQDAMALVKMIYEATSTLPSEEKFGLVSQMRRAAVSVPSNIAEGAARQSKKESIQFYVIARGSLSELDTQLELCESLTLLQSSQISGVSSQVDKVDGLLNGLIRFKRTA